MDLCSPLHEFHGCSERLWDLPAVVLSGMPARLLKNVVWQPGKPLVAFHITVAYIAILLTRTRRKLAFKTIVPVRIVGAVVVTPLPPRPTRHRSVACRQVVLPS